MPYQNLSLEINLFSAQRFKLTFYVTRLKNIYLFANTHIKGFFMRLCDIVHKIGFFMVKLLSIILS